MLSPSPKKEGQSLISFQADRTSNKAHVKALTLPALFVGVTLVAAIRFQCNGGP